MPRGAHHHGACPFLDTRPVGHAHSWSRPPGIGHYVQSRARPRCMPCFPDHPSRGQGTCPVLRIAAAGGMSSPPKRNGQGTCPVLGRADGQGGIMASGGDQDWACPVGAARHRVGHVQFWAGRVGKMGVCPVAAARTGHVQLGRGARTGHVQWGRPSAERDPGLDRNRGISGGVALVEQGPG